MSDELYRLSIRGLSGIGVVCVRKYCSWSATVSEKMGTLSALFPLAKRLKAKRKTTEVNHMKAEYDLSKMRSRRTPYAFKLKKFVAMRLSEDVVQYFKGMATEAGVPYQSLINLYLRDCLAQNRKVEIKWPSAA